MNLQTITNTLGVWLVAVGLKVLGAIALWLFYSPVPPTLGTV